MKTLTNKMKEILVDGGLMDVNNRWLGMYTLDEAGQPVACYNLSEWGHFMEGNRTLQRDQIGDAMVSTVFLGLDHAFYEGGKPILWETMIFGGPADQYQKRYTSREEALAGHAAVAAIVRHATEGCDECNNEGRLCENMRLVREGGMGNLPGLQEARLLGMHKEREGD